MRILHIVPTYIPAFQIGGPIASVHNLNKSLAQRGVQVTVFTTDYGVPEHISRNVGVDVDGVRVFYFPLQIQLWFYSYAMHRALADQGDNFDVFHITSVFLAASTLGARYARQFKKPFLISPRGSLMREPLSRKSSRKKAMYLSLLEKRNLANASVIHFTSTAERDEYGELGLPIQSSVVIPNSFDPSGFPPKRSSVLRARFRKRFGIAADRKVILFLGRLDWKKGLDTLIPAFAGVAAAYPKALLLIVGGDAGYETEARRFVAQHHVEDKTVFTGMLVGEEKISAFFGSDVFALPSYSENFGMAVVEAMYAGLPVVVTPGVGIAPMIQSARAGSVIPKETSAVGTALLDLLRSERKSILCGRRGRMLVEREFSTESVAKQFEGVYNALLKKTP